MTTADLNDNKLISEEISIIKDKLAKLANKKEIKHEEISDSEYEYKTDNGTDDERDEEQQNEIIETKNEIIETKNEIIEQEQSDNSEVDIEEDVREIKKMLDDEENIEKFEKEYKKKNRSIDLTKYIKKEIKQHLNCFELNISRLIKKYKHVSDISEDELLKIQSKYNTENRYFNKKSKKLLNKIEDYGGLTDDEYKKFNKKTKQINKKFTSFVSEFIDLSGSGSDSD